MPLNYLAMPYGQLLPPADVTKISVQVHVQTDATGAITSAQLVVTYPIMPAAGFRSVPPDGTGGYPLQPKEIGYLAGTELHNGKGEEVSMTLAGSAATLNLKIPLADPKKDYVR